MKRRLKALAAGFAAIAAVAVTATPAQAAYGTGALYKGCTNWVVFDKDFSDTMSGQGWMSCDGVRSIQRVQISVWYRDRFYVKDATCTYTRWCETPRLYVPYQPGYTYTAQNAGATNQDFLWPQSAWAIVSVTR